MSTTSDSQIFAEMFVVGDEFMDSGIRRTVNSVKRSENWTTVVCADGTIVRAANSRRIEILNPRSTVRPPFTGVEPAPRPKPTPRFALLQPPAAKATPPSQQPALVASVSAPVEETTNANSTRAEGISTQQDNTSPPSETSETAARSSSATGRIPPPALPAPRSASERELSKAAPKQLATITTMVEYILWGLLGLTILGSVIAATRTQTSICGNTVASASTCESHPYIIPSIAAAVIATAFYLFAIAIMRAIRLWAQRIAAGLPV
jgi:hypothetical protein